MRYLKGSMNQEVWRNKVWIRSDQLSPKHNKNICDVVHPGPVHVFSFFVSCGHEQQTPCDKKLHSLCQNLYFLYLTGKRIWSTHERR